MELAVESNLHLNILKTKKGFAPALRVELVTLAWTWSWSLVFSGQKKRVSFVYYKCLILVYNPFTMYINMIVMGMRIGKIK